MRYVRISSWMLVFAITVLVAPNASAQQNSDYDTGLNPYQSYQAGNIDSIDLQNRGLNVDIPLMSYPQRGGKLSLEFVLHYVNQGNWWNGPAGNVPCVNPTGTDFLTNGFRVTLKGAPTVPSMTCGTNMELPRGTVNCSAVVKTSDGSTRPMLPTSLTTWESSDGSGFKIIGTAGNPASEVLIDKFGTLYSGAGTGVIEQDTNGNKISFDATTGWVDTMNRAIPQPVAASTSLCPHGPLTPGSAETWNFPSLATANGGTSGTYQITLCYVTVSSIVHLQ